MGNYIVQADILDDISEAQLIQLTDDEKTGSINAARVSKAIDDSEGEVNSYIAVKHSVPLSAPIPAEVKRLSKDIAVYHLFGRRQRAPEDVKKRYDDAIAKLKDVAKGLATLGIDPPPAESTKATGGEVFGPERIFDRDKLSGF